MGVQLPSEPITRKEQYLAKAAGQAVEIPAEPITREEAYLEAIANAGGGGGGTTDYEDLDNKPQIGGVTLSGDKSLADLGIASATTVSCILDGASIDSFADVETALAGKQGTLTAGDYINLNNGNISVNRNLVGNNYDYEIKSAGDYKLTIIKSQGGTVISTNTYDYSYGTSTNIDNNFTIAGGYSGGNTWVYTALKDSTTHSTGYTWTKSVEATFEETEAFPSEDLSGYKLVIKSEMDSAINAAVSSAYHHAGTKTCAELVAGLLVTGNEGNVYNMTDSGTTTADFIEGQGQPIKAGDNVGIAKISDGVYKFDLLSGFVDTTNFVQKSQTAGLLKNDGTVNDEIEDDVTTLKSGLTNLDNEVNGDATTYPYADVITISDAVPSNLADCTVKIEPVQDLHGYDKPWVGGAGKNKLYLDLELPYEQNGVTITGDGNGGIYLDGTVTGLFSINGVFKTPSLSGQSTICKLYDGELPTSAVVYAGSSPAGSYYSGVQGYDTINNSGSWSVNLYFPNANKTFNHLHLTPMVVMGNEHPTVFEPYENICPIAQYDSCKITRIGKNLFSGEVQYADSNMTDEGKINNGNQPNYDLYAVHLKDGNYAISMTETYESGSTVRVMAFSNTSYVQSDSTLLLKKSINSAGASSGTFTVDGKNFLLIQLRKSIENTQIELGQTATSYKPYKGNYYQIELNGNTYYGKLRIDTQGNVYFDVDQMYRTFANSDTWQFGIAIDNKYDIFRLSSSIAKNSSSIKSDSFEGVELFGYKNYQLYVTADGKPAISVPINEYNTTTLHNLVDNTNFVYKIKEPFTIVLKDTPINLVKGQNTIYADTGDIEVTVNNTMDAIGSMQEQVNDIAEDVEDVQSGLDTVQIGLTTLGTRVNGIYTRTFYNDTTSTTLNNVYLPKTDKHTVAIIAGNDICTMVVSSSAIVEQNNIRNQITVALNENNQFVVSGCPYYSRPMFIATYDFRQQPT